MKKNYSLLFYGTFLLGTIVLFLFNSCSKEDGTGKEETKTESITLAADKDQYSPLEIVTITTSENVFATQSFTAKINDVEVIVGANENTASFLLPNLANGDYKLSFALNNKNYTIPIKVTALATILSADQYFEEVQTSINQNITNLNSEIAQLEQNATSENEYANLKNDVVKYTNLLKEYTASYNNLSTEEKQEFARSMAANQASIDEYNTLTAALHSSTSTLRSSSILDFEAGVEVSKGAFVSSVIFTVAHIPAMITAAKLIASPNPWVSAGAVVATGLIFTSYCINLDQTVTASARLTTKAIKPFEFLTENTETIYTSGIEMAANIQAKYKSLTDADSNDGSNGNTITTIVEKYNYFKDKVNGFVNAIPAIFRPTYVIASLKSTASNATRSVHNKYFEITNVSNPEVTLQQVKQADGSITIKATTTAKTDQTFTYDVNYTNDNFANSLKKTVTAKVIVPSCDTKTILGTWTVDMYNTCYPNPDGSPAFYQTNTLTLYEGGQSVFTYYDGTTAEGTYYYNVDCSFTFNNLTWCGGATAYPPSSPNYQRLHSCGCLSLKLTKQ